MKLRIRALGVSCLFFASSQALALFDAQLLSGRRWESDKDGKNGRAFNYTLLAAHIDPMPLLPLAFGASLGLMEILGRDKVGLTSYSVKEASLEVIGWLPMIPVVTPYARLGLPLLSDHTVKTSNDGKIESDNSGGISLSLGIKVGIVPLVKGLFEVGRSAQSQKVTKKEVSGVDVLTDDDKKDNAQTIDKVLFGIEVGF